jgi:1-acyl-sn-glycerol-3-phosphate acyltransferase
MREKAIMYKIFKVMLTPLFKLLYKPIIVNKEYVPTSGPIIICGNHLSEFDPVLVALSTKRVVHFLAKKELHTGIKRKFFESVGTIKVDRNIKDDNAVNEALTYLKNGYVIGLFPEGTRNNTKELLLPFKFGAVSMAKKTGAKIVPFSIANKNKTGRRNLRIIFGKPFEIGDMDLEKANELLYKKVRDLLLENKEEFSKAKVRK